MAISSKPSYRAIYILIFGIAFGLIALAIGYQGIQKNADLRSRASEERKIVKQWEFDASSGGWETVGSVDGVVRNGFFSFPGIIDQKLASIWNTRINTWLPSGFKQISISMKAGRWLIPTQFPSPTGIARCPKMSTPVCDNGFELQATINAGGCSIEKCVPQVTPIFPPNSESDTVKNSITLGVMCPSDTIVCSGRSMVGRSGPSCSFIPCPSPMVTRKFTAQVFYQLAGKQDFEKPLAISGDIDGKLHTYNATFPITSGIGILRIRIVFTSGFTDSDTVAIDWIRLMGPAVVNSTPTPSPTGISCGMVFGIRDSNCAVNYTTEVSFTCPDGYDGILGDGKTCTLIDTFKKQADKICKNHASCPTPYQTSYPTPYSTPYTTVGSRPYQTPFPRMTPIP